MSFRINKRAIIQYVLIYIFIIYHGNLIFKEYQNYFYIGTVALFAFALLTKKFEMSRRNCTGILALTVMLLFTALVSGGSLSIASIVNILSHYFIVELAYTCDKSNFTKRYLNLVVVLAAISIVLFAVQCIQPDILRSILAPVENAGNTYYGRLLFTMAPDHLEKNCGLFAEPGLFQIVLSSALFVLMFYDGTVGHWNYKRKCMLAVLLIALFTAQSTTGYISAIILVCMYLLSKQSKGAGNYKTWVVLSISVLVVWDLSRGADSMIQTNFFDKIFNTSGQLDLAVSTGGARLNSMAIDMAIALSHPFGAGYAVYEQEWRNYMPTTTVYSVSGVTTAFATIGFATTIFVFVYAVYQLKAHKRNWLTILAFLLIWINTGLAQPSIFFPAFLLLPAIENSRPDETEQMPQEICCASEEK